MARHLALAEAPPRDAGPVRAAAPVPLAPVELGPWLRMSPVRFEPLAEALIFRVERGGRAAYSGTLELRDPATGGLIGAWPFLTGGCGRGAAPRGEYVLGDMARTKLDAALGPRWYVREEGRDDGEVWDARVGDQRFGIEIHRSRGGDCTLGCFAVVASKREWEEFVAALQGIVERLGRVTFTVSAEHVHRVPIAHHVVGDE